MGIVTFLGTLKLQVFTKILQNRKHYKEREGRKENKRGKRKDRLITSNFGRVGEVYDVVSGTVELLQRRVVDEGLRLRR